MEIADYLKVARRRMAVLVGVPVLAGIIATGLIFLSPTSYSCTAWVNAPALVGGAFGNQYSGSQGTAQYVSAFKALATGPAVLSSVSRSLGMSQPDLCDNIAVDQDGASTVMSVTATDTKKDAVDPQARGVAAATLKAMFGSQIDLAKAQVGAAQDAVTAANKAIAEWESAHKVVDPEAQFSALLNQINSLQQQQVSMTANGNPTGAASAKALEATKLTEMQGYSALLQSYRPLVATRNSAQNSLSQAQTNLQSAQVQSMAADPAKVVYVTVPKAADKKGQVVSVVLPVIGAAVFLAIGLIFLLELLGRGRGTSTGAGARGYRRRQSAGSPDPSGAAPGGAPQASAAEGSVEAQTSSLSDSRVP